MIATRTLAAGVLALFTASALAGCLSRFEAVCGEGQYPVFAVDNPTGRACEDDGAEPGAGWARWPQAREPAHVGDEYDRWPLADDYPWRDEVDPKLLDRDQ